MLDHNLVHLEKVGVVVLGVIQNCHHYHNSIQSTLGGGGKWPRTLFLNVDYDALHFHTGSLKINIFKVLFWEGGVTKKSTLCTLLIMMTILGDPSRPSGVSRVGLKGGFQKSQI